MNDAFAYAEKEGICTTDLLLAFFGGAALGAGAALLMAPQAGAQTRERLKRLAQGAKEWAGGEEDAWHEDQNLEGASTASEV